MKLIRLLAEHHSTQHKILMIMVENIDKNNAVMISNKVFQNLLGLSRQTISKGGGN